MSDTPQIPRQVPLGKAVAGAVLATLISLAGAYMGSGDGNIVIPQPQPHPALVEKMSGIERRLDAIERRLEDPLPRQETQALAQAVAGLKERIDLWIARDTRMLAEDPRRRR